MGKYFDIGKKENRTKILDKYNGRCAYCGAVIDLSTMQIDHIIPLMRKMGDVKKKGTHTEDNCNPSCRTCNSSKSTLQLEKWREQLRKKVERLQKYHSIYRIAKSFKLIEETNSDVIFHFEKTQLNG